MTMSDATRAAEPTMHTGETMGAASEGGRTGVGTPGLPWYTELGIYEEVGFLARMARLAVLTNLIFESIVEPFGLSFNDYLVLGLIRRSKGGQSSPVRLCQVLSRTTGGMTLTLDRLAANGWLERSPNPDDRRRIIVRLTPTGHELSLEVNAALHRWEMAIVPDSARQQLLDSADRLLAVVSTDPAPPA